MDPRLRGYQITYKDGEINHCPGCGRTHWYIGRITAECAFCSTAIPLDTSQRSEPVSEVIFISKGKRHS